jgi:tripartite-type tricarboxylate transporter receptor subunit TctC
MQKRILGAVVFGVAALCAQYVGAQSDAYPNRPIRLIVPFPPGGSVDTVARLLAPKLSESLGQPIVIDNRSGASGNIGSEAVARAKPDGYTLLLNTLPFVVNPSISRHTPYDVIGDFAPISLISSSPSLLAVHPSTPARSVAELLALAKAKPGALNYSAAGTGTNPHVAGELFNLLGNVDIVAIQYKGGGPALTAGVAGEVGITIPGISEGTPYVKSGRIIALGITSRKRSPVLPDVPTIAEAGLPGYEFLTWHGLLAPKGTPQAVVTLLNEKIRQLLAQPEQAKQFEKIGQDIIASTPEEFSAHLKSELEKWARVVKERRLRAE